MSDYLHSDTAFDIPLVRTDPALDIQYAIHTIHGLKK